MDSSQRDIPIVEDDMGEGRFNYQGDNYAIHTNIKDHNNRTS